MDINEVNALSEEAFIRAFGNVVEHYPACAVYLARLRPFSDRNGVLHAAGQYLETLQVADIEEILCLHPDLVGKVADDGDLTAESRKEQTIAGLRSISEQLTLQLAQLNSEYKDKFGFPFIICARDNKFDAILSGLRKRCPNSRDQEIQTALGEVKKIVTYRIKAIIQ